MPAAPVSTPWGRAQPKVRETVSFSERPKISRMVRSKAARPSSPGRTTTWWVWPSWATVMTGSALGRVDQQPLQSGRSAPQNRHICSGAHTIGSDLEGWKRARALPFPAKP
ncbi:hypothetical protein F751_3187 [Auxenochlorella protothecoides]|uniref:Uncharacterized protein n=1 Tax=Auxenochlorella protothecoides TaxID=3075 RepID=A0A087SFG5_AUXPR|nr:hypothetical protein F751_3187 [Auxenochlorella protothecoides]KFM24469.1 hypothetical protein F751_3187 [Auxenochlorella protothecoides]